MSCVPTQHTLDEVQLLLQELQLRMTRAVEASPRLSAATQEQPHVLYEILASFFDAQLAQAQQTRALAIDMADVRRVWAFCLRELALSPLPAHGGEGRLAAWLRSAPSLPLSALQRGAPVVCAPSSAAVPPPSAQSDGGGLTSVFSLVRHGFAALMDAAYVVDQRLQRPTSSGAVAVVSLAALAASRVVALDRVQAVRLSAELADGVTGATVTYADGADGPPYAMADVAALLAGVWHTWGVLDVVHRPGLQSLSEQLVHTYAPPLSGGSAEADGWAAAAATSSPPLSFVVWLQRALRARGGAVHRQLCVEGGPGTAPAAHTGQHDAGADVSTPHPSGTTTDPTLTAAATTTTLCDGDSAAAADFWARLAS
ncbi:hypothetical protein NESM_000515400 [Novymonas esmeraldas]|uniref:Uncharacterized protein n=1 Tax=Novymonas esmeraldas TaxID=1808958 RepID=A0AAW0EQ64_9TRYP